MCMIIISVVSGQVDRLCLPLMDRPATVCVMCKRWNEREEEYHTAQIRCFEKNFAAVKNEGERWAANKYKKHGIKISNSIRICDIIWVNCELWTVWTSAPYVWTCHCYSLQRAFSASVLTSWWQKIRWKGIDNPVVTVIRYFYKRWRHCRSSLLKDNQKK